MGWADLCRKGCGSILCVVFSWVGAAEAPESLRLLNGDHLQGELVGMHGNRLVFRPAWGGEMEVPIAYAGRLLRHQPPDLQPAAQPEPFHANVQVTFVNGDRMNVIWVGSDETHHHFQTFWGQRVRSRRAWVATIDVLPTPEMMVLSMPLDLTRWRINDMNSATQEPRILGHRFELPGVSSLAYTLPRLPERMVLEFTLVSPTGFPTLGLDFLAKGNPNHPQTGLTFQINGGWMTVRSSSPRGRNEQLFRGQLLQGHGEHLRTHFRLYADLQEKSFLLRVDGQDFQEFAYETDERLVGASDLSIRFSSRNIMTQSVIEDLRIWQHEGPFPEAHPLPKAPRSDVFVLKNGDVLQARLAEMDGDRMQLRLPTGTLIEMEPLRVEQIRFQVDSAFRPRLNRRDLQVSLAGSRDQLTLQLHKLSQERLEGKSELFEELLVIPYAAVWKLVFNPHHHHRMDQRILNGNDTFFFSQMNVFPNAVPGQRVLGNEHGGERPWGRRW